ncbi:MAG: hypothetical protein MZV70_51990 [Desulfobacterales bacterium]|nr:hypothetical protein [Desulfobacterales bacterium]
MVMPDQKMLEQVRDMVNKMDLKSGLVVPFYVTVETHGTEGQVLNVEDKVKEVKEDIVVALGLSRSLVTGDGPNFATASVSLQKMLVMIREIKQAARDHPRTGYSTTGWSSRAAEDKTLQFLFNDLDPVGRGRFQAPAHRALRPQAHQPFEPATQDGPRPGHRGRQPGDREALGWTCSTKSRSSPSSTW